MNEWDPGDFKGRQQDGVWHVLNRLMMALILFAGITLVVCAFLPEIKKQREQATALAKLKEQIDEQKVLLARRTQYADLLRTNPEYIETMARDRLDWMKEGETIFRFPQEPDVSKMELKE